MVGHNVVTGLASQLRRRNVIGIAFAVLFYALALPLAMPSARAQQPPPRQPGPPAEERARPVDGDRAKRHKQMRQRWQNEDGGNDSNMPAEKLIKKREQFNKLASLPEDEVEAALEQWPPYQEMSLAKRGEMLQRIGKMRERRQDEAQRKAKQLGLEIPPDQLDDFTNAFWDKKLELDRKFWEEVRPIRDKYKQEIDTELGEAFKAYKTES